MKRTIWLVGIGLAIGLFIGVVIGFFTYSAYDLVTRTIPETRETVQVFNELNELRDQINKMNEERKKKEEEAAARPSTPPAAPTAGLPDLGELLPKSEPPADKPPPPKGDFAEVDAEIARLEETQRILNMILDKLKVKEK